MLSLDQLFGTNATDVFAGDANSMRDKARLRKEMINQQRDRKRMVDRVLQQSKKQMGNFVGKLPFFKSNKMLASIDVNIKKVNEGVDSVDKSIQGLIKTHKDFYDPYLDMLKSMNSKQALKDKQMLELLRDLNDNMEKANKLEASGSLLGTLGAGIAGLGAGILGLKALIDKLKGKTPKPTVKTKPTKPTAKTAKPTKPTAKTAKPTISDSKGKGYESKSKADKARVAKSQADKKAIKSAEAKAKASRAISQADDIAKAKAGVKPTTGSKAASVVDDAMKIGKTNAKIGASRFLGRAALGAGRALLSGPALAGQLIITPSELEDGTITGPMEQEVKRLREFLEKEGGTKESLAKVLAHIDQSAAMQAGKGNIQNGEMAEAAGLKLTAENTKKFKDGMNVFSEEFWKLVIEEMRKDPKSLLWDPSTQAVGSLGGLAGNSSVSFNNDGSINRSASARPGKINRLGGPSPVVNKPSVSNSAIPMSNVEWGNSTGNATSSASITTVSAPVSSGVESREGFGGGGSSQPQSSNPGAGQSQISGIKKAHSNVNLGGLNSKTVGALNRMQRAFGGPLTITSAYRSPSYNASVGGAKNSQHMKGAAVDVVTRGLSDEQKAHMLQSALSSGFTSVGFYPHKGFMHFDTRSTPATWGSRPSWASPIMNSMFGKNGGGAPMGDGSSVMAGGSGITTMGAGIGGGGGGMSGVATGMLMAQNIMSGKDPMAGIEGNEGRGSANSGGSQSIAPIKSTPATLAQSNMSKALSNLKPGGQQVSGGAKNRGGGGRVFADVDSIFSAVEDFGFSAVLREGFET